MPEHDKTAHADCSDLQLDIPAFVPIRRAIQAVVATALSAPTFLMLAHRHILPLRNGHTLKAG